MARSGSAHSRDGRDLDHTLRQACCCRPPGRHVQPRIAGVDPGDRLLGPVGMTWRRKTKQGELPRSAGLDEIEPLHVEPLNAQPWYWAPLGRGQPVGDVHHDPAVARCEVVDRPVIDVRSIHNHRAGRPGRDARVVVQLGEFGVAERVLFHRDMAGALSRHQARRAIAGRDAQLRRRWNSFELRVPVVQLRRQDHVVREVGVQQLVEPGGLVGIFGGDNRHVQPKVVGAEELMGQVEHLRMERQPVERAAAKGELGRHLASKVVLYGSGAR